MIADETSRRKALELTPIGDVWGIGRRLRPRFDNIGMTTALQYADMSADEVGRFVNLIGQRTWR